MATDHERLLGALLSQLSSNQASVRKKTVSCIGKISVDCPEFSLFNFFNAYNFRRYLLKVVDLLNSVLPFLTVLNFIMVDMHHKL